MLEKAERSFERLERLSDLAVNRALLGALDARALATDDHFVRANLLRRCGDLAGARAAFAAWIDSGAAPDGTELRAWSAVPTGLVSAGNYAIAPLVVIDDFLPVERMRALHAHACERESHFAVAKATNEGAAPSYDPERRQTMLDWHFTCERDAFLAFASDNFGEICTCLGLPEFEIERVEIKLTNHVDGGFFKTHNDNRAPFAESGRAVTWLYYFGEETPRYRGGDLYLQDSKPTSELLSPAWFTRIVPRPNRFVAFPSWFYHAVGPTTLPDPDFAAGRFAVSSHIRKAPGGPRIWFENNRIAKPDPES